MLEAVLGERIAGLEVLNPMTHLKTRCANDTEERQLENPPQGGEPAALTRRGCRGSRGFLRCVPSPGDISADKVIALDVLARLLDGRRVDVEMQIKVTSALPARLVFYGAREDTQQLRRGGTYDELCSTIVVAWLARPLFADLRQLHLVFELRARKTGRLFSDDLAIHILQLSEVTTQPTAAMSESDRNLHLWARFFTARTREEFAALAHENGIMASAVEALERISEDPEARRLAEEREDSLMLYNLGLARSKQEGRQEGRQEGERALLLRLLQLKFLELPDSIQQRVTDATDAQLLAWSERMLTASSLKEVFDE
jgi:predicted transposase/invertase (TIGR01784 family)